MTIGAEGREAIQFAIMPAYGSHPEIARRVFVCVYVYEAVMVVRLGLRPFVNF
jgi:hypothetical protein